jgi:iron complex transport system ATP-binding protein
VNIRFDHVNFTYPETQKPVFSDLSLEIGGGIYSLIGENGIGKTTFMLLAAGRLIPDSGAVFLLGTDTRSLIADEEKLNLTASFLYQNLEFETDEKVGGLLEYVLSNGEHGESRKDLYEDCIKVFELQNILNRSISKISKGEMQRAILAFSLLYGSTMVFMDEPVFALEDRQKNASLEYLSHYAKKESRSVYFSVHELELSRKFSDKVILFSKKPFSVEIGEPAKLLTPEKLEEVFQVPYALLHQKESLHRKHLEELDHLAREPKEN